MITLATAADLPRILALYAHARAFMAENGNPNQWGQTRPTEADIAAHNFDKITSLCKEARKTALGFEIAHVGVNAGDAEESLAVCRALDAAFGFGVKEGNSSNFAGSGVEVMKSPYLGKNGHIAVKTNSIPRAAAELAKNGFTLDEATAKYKGEKMVAVYLKQEFGGFAVHLLQK